MMMQYLSIRQTQDALLEMLIVLDDVFKSHNIRYTLDGGTLLGAVRHRGFIPWDDDIDILVPRPDFDEVVSHREWFPEGFILEAQGDDGFQLPFAKLFNTRWSAQEPAMPTNFKEFLWIDIFPGDALPDNRKSLAKVMRAQARDHLRATRASMPIRYAINISSNPVIAAAKILLLPLYRLIHPAETSYQRLARRAQRIPYGSSAKIGDVVWAPYKLDKPGFPLDDFDSLIELEFEGYKFKVCPHWDEYLSGLYGDYMTLPPKNQRATHGMKVWRAFEA